MVKLDADAVWNFAKAIKAAGEAPQPKRQATVQSVDADGTIWVQLPGADVVTPVETANADAAPGDTVMVEQRGSALHLEGNITEPAVGMRSVVETIAPVRSKLTQAADDADAAKLAAKAAQEAAEAASAANQHFWDDSNGAHVTEVEKDAWTDPQSADYHSGHNLLMNSLGIMLRKALNNLASITQSAIAFFDGQGNAASNVVASFGTDGFQAGKADESHLVGDYHSLRLVDKEGDTYFHVSDLRDATGYAEITERFIADGTTNVFTLSLAGSGEPDELEVTVDGVSASYSIVDWPDIGLTSTPADGSVVEATYSTDDPKAKAFTLGSRAASGNVGGFSVASGYGVTADGTYSCATGSGTTASGLASYAEGDSTVAGSWASHSEGWSSTADGAYSHAEGSNASALGNASHCEGSFSTASGLVSHAEGSFAKATGDYSHAQNRGTKAASSSQTAMGKYNVEDANDTYALIIGNGTADNARSNAHTLDWSGNADYAGEVTAHSGSTAHNLTDKADQADLSALETTVDAIGTVVSKDISTGVSSTSGSWTSVGSISLTEGTWVVIAGVQFPSNATGYRYVSLNDSNGTPAAAWTRATRQSSPAISGNATVLHTSHIIDVAASGKTIHLMAWQNGGSLSLTGRLNAIRVKG